MRSFEVDGALPAMGSMLHHASLVDFIQRLADQEQDQMEDQEPTVLERDCCNTRPGSRHENWCEHSTVLLEGYEERTVARKEPSPPSSPASLRSPKKRVVPPGKPF